MEWDERIGRKIWIEEFPQDKLKFIRGSISFYLGREKMKLHLPFHIK